jgi:hypothetical protein
MKKITAGELVNRTSDLRDLRFGLIAPEEIPIVKTSIPIFDTYRPIEYYELASPTDTQSLSSCESNSFCNILEAWISRIHHTRVSLDYNRLYEAARKRFWKSSDPGGLLLGQSAMVALEEGLLPPDTLIERVPIDSSEIYMALSRGPLGVGFRISDGWRLSNLSKHGAIAEDFEPIPNAGHAVALFGLNNHGPNNLPHHIILNSWGKDYGAMGGFLAMSVPTSIATMIDRPVSIIPGKMFVEAGNWKDWII